MTNRVAFRGAQPDGATIGVSEFARRVGIDVYTARCWAKCGRVPASKDDQGNWAIPVTALEELPLTAAEFAKRTGIAKYTVVRLCRAGKLKSWPRPVAHRLGGEASAGRRTNWEIDPGEVRRVLTETPGSFDAIRESREILESRALRESREILESAKAKRAAKKVEDEKFNGPIKTTKTRTRTKIPRKRGGQ